MKTPNITDDKSKGEVLSRFSRWAVHVSLRLRHGRKTLIVGRFVADQIKHHCQCLYGNVQNFRPRRQLQTPEQRTDEKRMHSRKVFIDSFGREHNGVKNNQFVLVGKQANVACIDIVAYLYVSRFQR